MVLVDGVFVPELSDLAALEPGLSIRSMAQALAEGDPRVMAHLGKVVPTDDVAVALNTAFMGDGAVIHVAAGAELARPIHLVFVNVGVEPASVFARSLAVIEQGARAMLIESHEGAGENQVNAALELVIGDDAHVDHVKITGEGAGALHVSSLMAAIGAQGAVQRIPVHHRRRGGAQPAVPALRRRRHDGEHPRRQPAQGPAACRHDAGGRSRQGGCTSREMFKTVLDDEARGVFQGKIIVRPHAQKTDAKMATHALLLSETAEADNKPELEIFADDVQCGHGATAGDLDEDLLFYLKARGIPAKEAEALLIQAFVGEAVEGIEHAGLRDALMEHVVAWLKARG